MIHEIDKAVTFYLFIQYCDVTSSLIALRKPDVKILKFINEKEVLPLLFHNILDYSSALLSHSEYNNPIFIIKYSRLMANLRFIMEAVLRNTYIYY